MKVKILKHDDYRTSHYEGKIGEVESEASDGRLVVGFGELDEDGFHKDWDIFELENVIQVE